MKIENAVALVTGANRGIGLAFARELLARGARKVYAAARDPAAVTLPGVQALRLDVNKPEEVSPTTRHSNPVVRLRARATAYLTRNRGYLTPPRIPGAFTSPAS